MTIPYQFVKHLNNGPCMKKNRPAPLQTTSLDLHVPMCILIFPELPVPHLISQSELKDLVRDLSIFNIQAELLTSLPQGWNLLQQDFRVPYRKRQQSSSFCLRTANSFIVMMYKDFCEGWYVHTTQSFCRSV
jgi:hypothetical protein